MALLPIQGTQMLGVPTHKPTHTFKVWIEIEEVDKNGEHVMDHDHSSSFMFESLDLNEAYAYADWMEWLVNKAQLVNSPDGLRYYIATVG